MEEALSARSLWVGEGVFLSAVKFMRFGNEPHQSVGNFRSFLHHLLQRVGATRHAPIVNLTEVCEPFRDGLGLLPDRLVDLAVNPGLGYRATTHGRDCAVLTRLNFVDLKCQDHAVVFRNCGLSTDQKHNHRTKSGLCLCPDCRVPAVCLVFPIPSLTVKLLPSELLRPSGGHGQRLTSSMRRWVPCACATLRFHESESPYSIQEGLFRVQIVPLET